jgi:NAD(P)-dependent dehydrogenase (short-subunit alcohol dehydrogenase family)
VAVARSRPAELRDGPNLQLAQVDVLDEASVADLFSRVPAVSAPVNLVGGYAGGRAVSELDLATFEGQLDINLKSAFLLTKHALRAMLPNGGGKIVHVASREAVRSGRNAFARSASRQGVVRLVEAVVAEEQGEQHQHQLHAARHHRHAW